MENIYSTAKPFYLLAKLVGVFSMSFQGPMLKGQLVTKWNDVFVLIISFATLLSLIIIKMNVESFIENESSILIKAWDFALLAGLLMLFITLSFQTWRKQEIKEFLKVIYNFDLEAKKLGIEIDHKKHRQVTYFATLSVIVINTFVNMALPSAYVYSGFVKSMKFIVPFAYGYIGLFKLYYTYQFSLASIAIRARFRLLNNFLRFGNFNQIFLR